MERHRPTSVRHPPRIAVFIPLLYVMWRATYNRVSVCSTDECRPSPCVSLANANAFQAVTRSLWHTLPQVESSSSRQRNEPSGWMMLPAVPTQFIWWMRLASRLLQTFSMLRVFELSGREFTAQGTVDGSSPYHSVRFDSVYIFHIKLNEFRAFFFCVCIARAWSTTICFCCCCVYRHHTQYSSGFEGVFFFYSLVDYTRKCCIYF